MLAATNFKLFLPLPESRASLNLLRLFLNLSVSGGIDCSRLVKQLVLLETERKFKGAWKPQKVLHNLYILTAG